MCGICGIYENSSQGVDKKLLQRMCSVMSYRGPDDEGYYTHGNIGLGMRRLSIIDLHTGKQPIHNEDKTIWIVFNGEIYNFPELRDELEGKGHKFYTHSDTETIVHLYEEYAEDCVKHLNGMFSFAIWDSGRKQLMIARDRMGIKPLYYALYNGMLIFGSEIKCILQIKEISREIDFQSLDNYFTFLYVPSPMTIFENIKKLPPGHILLSQNGEVKIQKYWDVEYKIEKNRDIAYYSDVFLEKFREAVRMRLISDVPLGALLSGGIDSSAVVAIMSEYSSKPVETFSIGYGEEGAYYDEREYAKIVSNQFQTNHHEFIVKPDISKLIPEIIKYFDEPFADSSAIPNYYVSQMTRQHVTVALSGLGGDEMAGGYERYLGILLLKYYKTLPKHFREKVITKLVNAIPDSRKGNRFVERVKRFVNTGVLPVDDAYFNYISAFSLNQKKNIYSDFFLNKLKLQKSKQVFDEYFFQHKNLDILNRLLFADLKMYLSDDLLTLTDRMSMAHSLELRVPFIDYKVVEFMATIPPEMKIKGLTKKYLLKKAFSNILPDSILYRKKRGFTAPITVWLRDELTSYLKTVISEDRVRKLGLFKWEKIKEMLDCHLTGKENYHSQIWALIMFFAWYDIYIEKL